MDMMTIVCIILRETRREEMTSEEQGRIITRHEMQCRELKEIREVSVIGGLVC